MYSITLPIAWRRVEVRAHVRRDGWLERLAVWAERQPHHRRLGSWTELCFLKRDGCRVA